MKEPEFGRAGMSRDIFKELLRCSRFTNISYEQGSMSSTEYVWAFVEQFVKQSVLIAPHNFSKRSFRVDQSFSRRYALRGFWMSTGIPHCLSLNRKLEARCEIQDVAYGSSGVIMHWSL